MSPTPTGRLRTDGDHTDLELIRRFDAPITDVWASITESDRTALWYGSWSGTAGPGATITVRMGFEEDAPESLMTINSCDEPSRLELTGADDEGGWHIEARLAATEDTTTMTFVHHLDAGADVGSIGPGWEYYLDALVASRTGAPAPDFDDYYPAQQAYFEALTP